MNKLFVVGLGPGDARFLTGQARQALDQAQLICGYSVYIDLIRPLYPDKDYYTTPMKQEIDRCRHALASAQQGIPTAMVCSGDAGVYGMASPVLELSPEYPDVDIEVVPGITAALSGGAVLGAPLGHDFCVISLSDLLTPWQAIENRLTCAAKGDFALCLYNPGSRKRADYLQKAVQILLRAGKDPQTACGYVRNIGREGQSARVLTLAQLETAEMDMFTTVFIGSSTTRILDDRLITPRGYRP